MACRGFVENGGEWLVEKKADCDANVSDGNDGNDGNAGNGVWDHGNDMWETDDDPLSSEHSSYPLNTCPLTLPDTCSVPETCPVFSHECLTQGFTALMRAVDDFDEDGAARLVEAQADINARSNDVRPRS
eukprot:1303298-Rhodomonas_salina.1